MECPIHCKLDGIPIMPTPRDVSAIDPYCCSMRRDSWFVKDDDISATESDFFRPPLDPWRMKYYPCSEMAIYGGTQPPLEFMPTYPPPFPPPVSRHPPKLVSSSTSSSESLKHVKHYVCPGCGRFGIREPVKRFSEPQICKCKSDMCQYFNEKEKINSIPRFFRSDKNIKTFCRQKPESDSTKEIKTFPPPKPFFARTIRRQPQKPEQKPEVTKNQDFYYKQNEFGQFEPVYDQNKIDAQKKPEVRKQGNPKKANLLHNMTNSARNTKSLRHPQTVEKLAYTDGLRNAVF